MSEKRNLDIYTLDYSGFGSIAIKGIQELQQKILTLEARLAAVEGSRKASDLTSMRPILPG